MTVTDASFVIAHEGGGRYVTGRLIGATLPQWITWVAGTAVGVLLAPSTSVMHTLGLDVVFPAFFLLLALDEVSRSRRALAASLLGATVSGLLLLVTNPGYALLGATVGALLGVRKEQGVDG
jgi:predicted branched-subunit amino acid permease